MDKNIFEICHLFHFVVEDMYLKSIWTSKCHCIACKWMYNTVLSQQTQDQGVWTNFFLSLSSLETNNQ